MGIPLEAILKVLLGVWKKKKKQKWEKQREKHKHLFHFKTSKPGASKVADGNYSNIRFLVMAHEWTSDMGNILMLEHCKHVQSPELDPYY